MPFWFCAFGRGVSFPFFFFFFPLFFFSFPFWGGTKSAAFSLYAVKYRRGKRLRSSSSLCRLSSFPLQRIASLPMQGSIGSPSPSFNSPFAAACCSLIAVECSTKKISRSRLYEYNLPLDLRSFRQIPFSSSSIQKISKRVDIIILFANAKPRALLPDCCCLPCRKVGTANIISEVRCSR